VLDHILVSAPFLERGPEFAPVHMNSEFDDEEQQSDHDPPVARLRVTDAND
jgi:hypothetical protein